MMCTDKGQLETTEEGVKDVDVPENKRADLQCADVSSMYFMLICSSSHYALLAQKENLFVPSQPKHEMMDLQGVREWADHLVT